MEENHGIRRFFARCSDRKKCMFLASFVAIVCLGAAYTLYLAEEDLKTVTMVDGVYYDNNPWTKSE